MEASFEEFVRSRGPALLRYAHLLCGDAGRAEDLVQDALVKVHRRWSASADLTTPFAYTRRAVTNEYLSWRRRLANHELPSMVPDRAVAPAGDRVADRDLVWSVIRDLPRRQRVVVVLRYYEDLGDREIAGVLGVAEGTVRSLASRAFAALREHPELTEVQPRPRRVTQEQP
ncbi:SigE family RNA polymerase sigma factor [Terrabacter sp. 2RAF25]|uniref:SigE family RNA polymerase sigma factor n=1 Tax=Terrabacter sp. 2RAF25 TaxID=3232998 RepID=UPI003F9A1BBD